MSDAHESSSADRFGSASSGMFRSVIMPIVFLISFPILAIVLWVVCIHYDGSVLAFVRNFDLDVVLANWPMPSWSATKMLLVFIAIEAVLLVVLPGKVHEGPVSPRGRRPRYKLNGVAAFVVTHALFFVAAYPLGLFSPGIVYTHFGEILMTLNLTALLGCLVLYFKGKYWPSTPDASTSGNFIWDYYWGVELYPSVADVSLKQLVNCRVAMMGWSVIIVSFAAAQAERIGAVDTAMLVCVGLQLVYIFKFFWWEGGYFNSIDIMHDRFGFYICWGILVWLPSLYTIATLYLVDHPRALSPLAAAGIALFGLAAIWVNYAADAQRKRVRATSGDTTIWRRKPETTEATYTTLDGEQRTSLLLYSGWWGVARHFNYVAEIALAVAWTLPVGFAHFIPWAYVVFLTVLLVDRSFRDELRCRGKYGDDWQRYCEHVPYKLLPSVY